MFAGTPIRSFRIFDCGQVINPIFVYFDALTISSRAWNVLLLIDVQRFVNIFCSLVNAGFPTMASNSNAFIVMRIHSRSRNINFLIKLLLSGNIDFSVMLSTNSKAINMILG